MPRQKILFRLERDDDGYPPVDFESVWAEETQDGGFILDNIPFFTIEATLGDIVEVNLVDGEILYQSIRHDAGNSLLRVVFFDGHDPSKLRSDLANLGCATELSHLQSLIAVHVPPNVNIDDVRAILDEGARMDYWDYEEAILSRSEPQSSSYENDSPP